MTADEIHQLGLSEVARISSEMEKVKEQVGFTGDLKEFFNYVRNKKELMPYSEPTADYRPFLCYLRYDETETQCTF